MTGRNIYRLRATAAFIAAALLCGCTAKQYRKSADKQIYKIIQEKQKEALGKTNEFTINTPYSNRKPEDINPQEIIDERQREGKLLLTLTDALRIAVENSRDYQVQKESLYVSALSLSSERWRYVPQFTTARSTAEAEHQPGGDAMHVNNSVSVDTLLKTGGKITLDLANDLLRFTTGNRSDRTLNTVALSLAQPLLRGAGADVVAENLTQRERQVIYEVRSFAYYQQTFAFDILSTYLRLLQRQDNVKNQYNNYLSRVALRERSVALAYDRLAPFQADQARQEELAARNSYILTVEGYRTALDQFKFTLGLPAGTEIQLDSKSIQDLETLEITGAPLTDNQSFKIALDHRLDLLNRIDAFEDSKRKIKVAASSLKPGLLVFGDFRLNSTDYGHFDFENYNLSGGVQFDPPLNRRIERNAYRNTIITFELAARSLGAFIDDLKNDVRGDLRALDQSRQSFDIQKNARELAERRVESSDLSLQAGRIQVRDVVDAQNSLLQANIAATAALVDYHLARLRLLLDLGVLKTEREKFWLEKGDLPGLQEPVTTTPMEASNQLITPEELFKNDTK
jgi:outer membrane protein TolC